MEECLISIVFVDVDKGIKVHGDCQFHTSYVYFKTIGSIRVNWTY